MKLQHFILIIILLIPTKLLYPQQSLLDSDTIVYTNALNYRIIGKGFKDTEEPFDRLPAELKGKIRQPVWDLSKNSAGIGIRFRSNSSFIAIRYELALNMAMNHMASTGIKGIDLYCLEAEEWRYIMTACPNDKKNNVILVQNMTAEEKEFLLYLPLYDGVQQMEIGTHKNSCTAAPEIESPTIGKPVVVYGTSITQGGCASRPGMAYTNILSRKLNREFVNLGFSGNGRLDMEIAYAIDKIDPACIIIDCVPNCTLEEIEEKVIPFIRHIREIHSTIPILMVEGPYFPHQKYDTFLSQFLPAKNYAYKAVFEQLEIENSNNIYYLENTNLTGDDREGTVDGIHLTDLGFFRMAESLYPILESLLY